MKKINLTNEKSNTVHVDDVDVTKTTGVYGIPIEHTNWVWYVTKDNGQYVMVCAEDNDNVSKYCSLSELIITEQSGTIFYHIPTGKQITTEKELTLADLKNTDHVGFLTENYGKFEVVSVGNDALNAIGASCDDLYRSTPLYSIKDLILINTTRELYLFDTRKELYKWLSE